MGPEPIQKRGGAAAQLLALGWESGAPGDGMMGWRSHAPVAVCTHLATRSSFFMVLSFFMNLCIEASHIHPFPISFEPAGKCAVSNETKISCRKA